MRKKQRIEKLEGIISSIGDAKCEEIELTHQIESMSERIAQLTASRQKGDSLIKVMDKRRHTRERLTEVRVEIQELQTEKEQLEVNLEHSDE